VKIHCYYPVAIIQAALLTIASPVAQAEEPTMDGYVTRKEYEELKAQMLAMKQQLDALKKEREASPK
jgi:ABC-type taurine transport system substrate-binding protein